MTREEIEKLLVVEPKTAENFEIDYMDVNDFVKTLL